MNHKHNGHTNGIVSAFTQRKDEILTATVLRHGRKRAADVAGALSRRGAWAAGAELCNESVGILIALAYETDGSLGRVNVDHDGRLLVPVPWGRNGRYKFGLRPMEADALRLHCYRLMDIAKPEPLFTYDPVTRSWYVNLFDYGNLPAALGYWKNAGMDAQTYRTHTDTVRSRRTNSA